MSDLTTFLVVLGCKVSLLLGIVAALVFALGRCWPVFCTAWQRASIVALLVLPLAISFAPAIYLPVRPVSQSEEAANSPKIDQSMDVGASNAPDQPLEKTISWDELNFDSEVELVLTEPPTSADNTSDHAQADPSRFTSAEAVTVHRSTDWNSILLISIKAAYLVIAGMFLIRLARTGRRLMDLRRNSTPIDAIEWKTLLETWTTKLNVRRTVVLLASDEIPVPMTFGWLKPIIMVPRKDLASYRTVEREAILVHELMHIARNDFFWQIVMHVTSAAYWCHPLAWYLRRSSDNLRERICDLFCSQLLGHKRYAQALITIAAQSQGLRIAGLGMAMAHQSSLGRRLDEMKTFERRSRPGKGNTGGVLVCTIAALVSGAIVIGTLTERPSQAIPVSHSFSDPSMYDVDQTQDPAPDGDGFVATTRSSDALHNYFDAQPVVAFGTPNLVNVHDIVVSTTLNSAGVDFLQPDESVQVEENSGGVFIRHSGRPKRTVVHFTSPPTDASASKGSTFRQQEISFEDPKETYVLNYDLSRGIQAVPVQRLVTQAGQTVTVNQAQSSANVVPKEISNSIIDLTATSDGTVFVTGIQFEEKQQEVQKRKHVQYVTSHSDPRAWQVQEKKDPQKERLKTTRAEAGASDAY